MNVVSIERRGPATTQLVVQEAQIDNWQGFVTVVSPSQHCSSLAFMGWVSRLDRRIVLSVPPSGRHRTPVAAGG
jgi:hypothetical protein